MIPWTDSGSGSSPACSCPAAVLGDEQAAVDEHPHELLRVERVALGAREQGLAQLVGTADREQQQRQQPSGLVAGQRRERDRQRVAVAAPAVPPLLQVGTRGAEQEQRRVAAPVGEVLDEVEQPLVGPVQVLEHEHERRPLGHRLDVAPPRGEGLVARLALGRAGEADQRAQVLLDPRRLAGVAHERRAPTSRASRRPSPASSVSRIPASLLTISSSAQYATPSP